MTIRVRFAPSPTGELHIGGARTAVFNWLFARRENGKFLLRIEDTDIERSSNAMTAHILEGLTWLGLDWDEKPFYQSRNVELHKKDAFQLLEKGAAYRCFCDAEQLANEREVALKAGAKSWKYSGKCRNLTKKVISNLIRNGKSYSIRFKVMEGRTEFLDLVHGLTSFDNENIEDFILLRSNGMPTYHLSVVSDDISMEITHVVRGDDHISNTPKQILIYRALGKTPPEFGHIPLILGPDKKRLSKRHGATSLLEYRDKGYLPQAVFNFISLLGWAPGENKEYLTIDELKNFFSFEGINRAGAVFDERKLEWLNSKYLAELSFETLLSHIKPFFEKAGVWKESYLQSEFEHFKRVIEVVKVRCHRLDDIPRDSKPYLTDDFNYDERGVKKYLSSEDVIRNLEMLKSKYESLDVFDKETAEKALRNLAERLDQGADKFIHPLRIALVGVPVSPGVFEVAELMGKIKTIERLERLIVWLKK